MASKNEIASNTETIITSNPRIKLFHPGLKDLLDLEQYCDSEIGFLSIENLLPLWYKKFTQIIPSYAIGLHLRREYRHFSMGIQALKLKSCDTLFLFEAYNQHLILLLPLLLLTRKNILIMLHGNQQFAIQSKIKYWTLLYLKLFLILFKNLKVILLEIDDTEFPNRVKLPDNSKIVVPHPIVQSLNPSSSIGERLAANQSIKIGIVGIIREDKPISKLIEKAQNYASNNGKVELIIGTPLKQKSKYLEQLDVTIRDTTKEKDYFQTLQEIDILVTVYDRDRYYYRTSGVISDAGSAGCYIIAPDYPLIRHQITYPVTIGDTYQDFSELANKLDRGIDFIRENGRDNHWLWREKRTAESIAKIIFPEC